MIEPEMRGNIGALFGVIAPAQPHFWQQHPDPQEWSPIQIICHLVESEIKVQRPRLERIFAEDNPFLPITKPPLSARDAVPCGDDGLPVAERFRAERCPPSTGSCNSQMIGCRADHRSGRLPCWNGAVHRAA
jgi:hypothetical protein